MSGTRVYQDEVIGFLDGWRGVVEERYEYIGVDRVRGILSEGGTILGTSRTNPFAIDGGPEKVVETLSSVGVDAVVAIGGDDTLGVAARLFERDVNVVGVPKTIDNDLAGTELTFGFDTAVQTATEAIDRLHTTAESHHRIIVCEVMGRHAGWIAAYAGIAGGAAEILVPEVPFSIDAVCDRLRYRHSHGQYSSIVVIAEGAVPTDVDGRGGDRRSAELGLSSHPVDEFGHPRLGGIGAWLSELLEERTGFESRVTTLGHVQRGGTPTAFDRVLATRFGVAAVRAVHDGDFGVMVALKAGEIQRVRLSEAVGRSKTLDLSILNDVAAPFLG
jgi:6-phosphofructokinase 1